MYRNDISPDHTCNISIIRVLLVSFVWILGFLIGNYFASQTADIHHLLLHNIAFCSVSFLGLYFALFFPFILSAFLIRSPVQSFTLLIVFAKALSIGFCACGIMIAFSSAGWLMRSLLLFSDSLIVILLLWFWIRNYTYEISKLNTDLSICAVLSFIISCIDYFAVSPFLEALLNM